MTRKTSLRTAQIATRTSGTSTRTSEPCTGIARICATTSADTKSSPWLPVFNYWFRKKTRKAARSSRPAFFIGKKCFSSDANGAFENLHGGAADAGDEFLPALRDFHFEMAWATHFRALKNA